MGRKYRRRNYFTKKNFQSRFIIRFLVVSYLWNILVIFLFNELASRKIDSILYSMTIPAADTASILLRETVYANVAAAAFVILTFFVTAAGVYGRIDRSLYRLRVDLARIARGDLGSRIMPSEDDEFRDFADEMNSAVSGLQHRFSGMKHHVRSINEAVKRIRTAGNVGDKAAREQLLQHIVALESEVKGVKR